MQDKRLEDHKKQTSFDTPSPENYSWKIGLSKLIEDLRNNTPVVLFGPPGTGKSRMVFEAKSYLENEKLLGKFEVIQFHKKFTYEDFIEGFTPAESGGFSKKDGIFKKFCKDVGKEPVNVFFIDEMNRAELTTTLGELLYLIEDRGTRVSKTAHFEESFSIPQNVSIVGTMNTADRNIAVIDYALRRRFRFIPVFPDYEILLEMIIDKGFEVAEFSTAQYIEAAKRINSRISKNRLMGRNMQLGHTMWIPKEHGPIKIDDIVQLFQLDILPQLESYCGFGYEDELKNLLIPSVAEKYLDAQKLTPDDITGLIMDLNNKHD